MYAIHNLSPSDEWLINYNFRRPPISYEKHIALGLLLDVPLGRNKNINAQLDFWIFNGTNVNEILNSTFLL